MALTGTLRDFGIADILQLIGQQQKTGILHLNNKEQTVNVHFVDGNVVKAESASRVKKDLLGNIMVRAGVMAQEQLDAALAIQKRTLRRLGDILVAENIVDRDTFRQMYQLQTTETLYRLFHWKDGTYEFEQQDVDYDEQAIQPIRSENVLMEGFRMVDEWPMVRRLITSYEMTFERLKEVPAAPEAPSSPTSDAGDDDDPFGAALDAAFTEAEGGEQTAPKEDPLAGLGGPDRQCFEFAEPDRSVQEIIDLSRLGEFETCKSLHNLVRDHFLRAIPPIKKGTRPMAGARPAMAGSIRRAFIQLAVGVGVLAGVGGLAYFALGAAGAAGRAFTPRAGQALLEAAQMARLRNAIQVFKLETGKYPARLQDLVQVELLGETELSYPYGDPYYYRREDDSPSGYLLLPPLP